MHNAQEGPLCNLRTTQALISLRLRCQLTEITDIVVCRWTYNVHVRLHVCTCITWLRPVYTKYELIYGKYYLIPLLPSVKEKKKKKKKQQQKNTTSGFDNILSWRFVHEIFSTVILSLPLIQEGQLSVAGERLYIIRFTRLEDWACPVKVWLSKLTALDLTPLGWLGR